MAVIPLAVQDAPARDKVGLGRRDLAAGLRHWPMWWLLAVRSVKGQYRRTVLGPWWMTIQMAVFIVGLAVLFGMLLGEPLETFLPFVGVGYIGFGLISGTITAGCRAFIAAAGVVKSTPAPLSVAVYRVVTVELIQFLHDAVLYLPLVLISGIAVGWQSLLAVPVVAAIVIGGVGLGLWLGPLAARFRDVSPLVQAVIRLLFFLTPIFWNPDQLSDTQRVALASWNPLAYLLSAFRAPLIGGELHPAAYVVTALWAVVNLLIGVIAFSLTRSRLAYWV